MALSPEGQQLSSIPQLAAVRTPVRHRAHELAIDAATVVKTVEPVPDIPIFRKNTAAFVYELKPGAVANVDEEIVTAAKNQLAKPRG